MSNEMEPNQIIRCPALRVADTVTGRTTPPMMCAETGLSPFQDRLPNMLSACPIKEAVSPVPCMIYPARISTDAPIRRSDLKSLVKSRPNLQVMVEKNLSTPERQDDQLPLQDSSKRSMADELRWDEVVRKTEDAGQKGTKRLPLSPQDREDARQDALLKMYRSSTDIAGGNEDDIGGLAYTATRRAGIDITRRAARIQEIPSEELGDRPAHAEPFTTALAERDALQQALVLLSPDHRIIVELVEIYGITVVEAAALLKIPRGTASSRLYYAKKALRKQLKASNQRTNY